MAAHPFGPIENQLIVGYYKRGFHPTRVLPVLGFKDVRLPQPNRDTVFSLLQPVFYGWSPANGNSSSHDFQVTYEYKYASTEDLLSRGLGYRITFTMNQSGLAAKDDPPKIHFEITDIFGAQILARFEPPPNFWFGLELPKGYNHKSTAIKFRKYRTLVYQLTPLHLKVVENDTVEHVVPTYSPPESPISYEADRCLDLHMIPLGLRGDLNTMRIPTEHIRRILLGLKAMVSFLSDRQGVLDQRCKQLIRTPFMLSLKVFSDLVLYFSESGDIELSPVDMIGLQTSILEWFDGRQDFPANLAVALIDDVLKKTKNALTGRLRHTHWERLVKKQPRWERLQVSDISLLATWVEACAESSANLEEVNLKSSKTSISFLMKDFTLRYNYRVGSMLAHENNQVNSFQYVPLDLSYLCASYQEVFRIPNSNMLVFMKQDSGGLYSHVNLVPSNEKCKALAETSSLPPLPEGLYHQDGVFIYSPSSRGIFASSTPSDLAFGKVSKITAFYYLFGSTQSAKTASQNDWVSLELQPFPDRPYFCYQSISQSKRNLFLGISAGSPMTVQEVDTIYLACLQYSQETNQLRVVSSILESTTLDKDGTSTFTWVKSKRGYSYPCLFSSEELLAIWVYYDLRFVPLVRNKRLSQRLQNLKKEIHEFALTKELAKSTGLFGWKRSKGSQDFDSYRVGRLYFKY